MYLFLREMSKVRLPIWEITQGEYNLSMKQKYKVVLSVFIAVYENRVGHTEILLHRRINTGFRDGYYDMPSGMSSLTKCPFWLRSGS